MDVANCWVLDDDVDGARWRLIAVSRNESRDVGNGEWWCARLGSGPVSVMDNAMRSSAVIAVLQPGASVHTALLVAALQWRRVSPSSFPLVAACAVASIVTVGVLPYGVPASGPPTSQSLRSALVEREHSASCNLFRPLWASRHRPSFSCLLVGHPIESRCGLLPSSSMTSNIADPCLLYLLRLASTFACPPLAGRLLPEQGAARCR